MSFGQNFLNLITENAQPILLAGLIIGGLYLLYKRELTKFVGFLFVAIIAVALVYAPTSVKDFLLNVFNRVAGVGGTAGISPFLMHMTGTGIMCL